MPIETKTNGEIRTREQFEQEMAATAAEAAATFEAAGIDLQTMTDDVTRVDNIVASLTNFEIDSATRQAVMELAATNADSKAAELARMKAAEQRQALAKKVIDTFNNAGQTKFHNNAN